MKTFKVTVKITGWNSVPAVAKSPSEAKELVESDVPHYLNLDKPLSNLSAVSLEVLEVKNA